MKSIKIRPAKEEDSATVAKLIFSTELSPRDTWGGETDKECLKNLEELILSNNSKYSLKYITVAERFGEVVGAIVIIQHEELEKLNIATDFKIMTKFKGVKDKLYFILDCIKLMICGEGKKGDLYISNIATSISVRGLGIGKVLMDYAEKIAKKDKCDRISLLAKDEDVSHFYKKLNYTTKFDKMLLGERFIRMAKYV